MPPTFDEVVKQAVQGLDNDDVRLFLTYFEELKQHVRCHLGRKARVVPGDSAIVQSALLSMLCDVAQKIPLGDVDEYGYPALWPLLLRYLERHCNKWNAWYKAQKRDGHQVSLGQAGGDEATALELADSGSDEVSEARVGAICEELVQQLTEEERVVFDRWCQGHTLAGTAAELNCSESKVSYVRERICQRLTA
jgi:DNA-directed RNA polymerase specialized sigma24 family protein